jgi:GT2 family glycosyltransferase
MNVAVLVLTWHAATTVMGCLETLARQRRVPDHILVVDNASQDDTVARIEQQFPNVSIIRNRHNLGYPVGMNTGLQALQALPEPPDIVALLNQDTLLEPAWLGELVAPFETDQQVGAVGCKIRYPDGTLQHAGVYLEWPRAVAQHVGWHEPDRGQHDQYQFCDIVTGAALALRMQALDRVGLFDPGYSPAYYEDTDLCWRLRRHGYRIAYTPKAVLTHYESLSIRDEATRSKYYNQGRLRFVLKTYELTDILGPFAESERSFIHEHGHTIEARALRWAYLETLANLPEILKARSVFYPPVADDEAKELTDLLIEFKHAVTRSLYHRARSTIDAIQIL